MGMPFKYFSDPGRAPHGYGPGPLAGLLLCFLFSFPAQAATLPDSGEEVPVLCMDAALYDFGEILSGEVRVKRVHLQNQGKGILKIYQFDFSCGCSIPRITRSDGDVFFLKDFQGYKDPLVLESKEFITMDLEFLSLGRKGKMTYKMVIHSNDPAHPELTIPILALVLPAFEVKPRWVRFGKMAKGEPRTREVIVTSVAAGDFEITGIANLPPYLSYTVESIPDSDPRAYRLKLTHNGEASRDDVSLLLKAEVESEKCKGFGLSVSFEMLPDVTLEWEGRTQGRAINFGMIPRGETVTRKVRILNHNPEVPCRIEKVDTSFKPGDGMEAVLEEVRPGMEYELSITIKPEFKGRILKGSIRLISDHPDLKDQSLALKGMVQNKKPEIK
jgi:hypothetical protein